MTLRHGVRLPWWLLIGLPSLFGWYFSLSLAHWRAGLATSYDLGIFSQIASAYAHGQVPVPTLLGYPAFGDHFSPLNVLWGAAWWVWPDPRALLVVQAVSLAVGVTLMALLAHRTLPGWTAAPWCVLMLGALGGQILPGVLFDVHEVALGLPLVSLVCWAFLRERAAFLVAAAPLLVLVKEDLGITVVAAGLLWAWAGPRQQRWASYVVVGIGVMGLVAAYLTISHVSPTGTSPQATFFADVEGGQGWLGFAADVGSRRLAPTALFLATAGIVGARSRLALLAIPTLVWRIVSAKPTHWGIEYHYDLLLWPIALASLLDVMRAWRGRALPPSPVRLAGVVVALVASMAVGVQLIVQRHVAPADFLSERPSMADIRGVAATLPGGSRVAAQNDVGVYLIPRFEVFQYHPSGETTGVVDYLIVGGADQFELNACARRELDALLSGGEATIIERRGAYALVRLAAAKRLAVAPCDR